MNDEYDTVIATLHYATKIPDWADSAECSLAVGISNGQRRCVWHVYDWGMLDQLTAWLRGEHITYYVNGS